MAIMPFWLDGLHRFEFIETNLVLWSLKEKLRLPLVAERHKRCVPLLVNGNRSSFKFPRLAPRQCTDI
jgi:hypothetical protein